MTYWWACPSYSGCDSEIEFPLDVGCKRQGVKLNFELKGVYVMSLAEIWLQQVHHNTSRLRKRGVGLVCVSCSCVEQDVEQVAVITAGKRESLDTIRSWLVGHVLIGSNTLPESQP